VKHIFIYSDVTTASESVKQKSLTSGCCTVLKLLQWQTVLADNNRLLSENNEVIARTCTVVETDSSTVYQAYQTSVVQTVDSALYSVSGHLHRKL